MARLIFKCRYMKSGNGAAGYLIYIATREGVEKLGGEWKPLPATEAQRKLIGQLLKDFPDMRGSFEHQDYLQSPTRETATEFITAALDQHADQFARREQYVGYISRRPHVEKQGAHGLFSDTDEPVTLADVMRDVAAHEGAVYTPIISLRREDAARLGFDSAARWRNLLRSHAETFAEQFKIPPDDLRWYAAFHNESHHPHVHMIVYSAGEQGYLTHKGLDGMRSALARDIFKQDLMQIYLWQTAHRNDLREEARELIQKIAADGHSNPVVDGLLRQLAGKLAAHKGKKVYGYLNDAAKNIVNAVVDELAKDGRIARLYDLWYEQREAVLATYRSEMPERIPLSQNSEFKAIKNAVIAEAAKLLPEQTQTAQPSDKQQAEQAQQAAPRNYAGDVALGSFRLLGQLSRLIENKIDDGPRQTLTESKLLAKIREKKQEQGLR
ncbi:MAG: relaxase MobL [Oscillospiraceae bacterium]|nr:relaxase MobL [Oscillospiraceae bacterium]